MKWYNYIDSQTIIDASDTAYNNYGITDLVLSKYMIFTPAEFDELSIENHRAELGKSIDEIFPPNDRPRGSQDIQSVRYHMTHKTHPVVLLQLNERLIVLDGVHRIVAAYLTNSSIHAAIFISEVL